MGNQLNWSIVPQATSQIRASSFDRVPHPPRVPALPLCVEMCSRHLLGGSSHPTTQPRVLERGPPLAAGSASP